MNRIEILEEIIRQRGCCDGINCNEDKCPLSKAFGNGLCNPCKDNLKLAKEMLAEEKNKEKPKFKVGSEVVWNGKMDSKHPFSVHKKEFLKSKDVHVIDWVSNDNHKCTLGSSSDNIVWDFDVDWFDLVEGGEKVDKSIREQIKINNKLLNPKTKKQHKLKILEEHKEWLEYQLEEVLNGTEWVTCKDNRKYKINSNTSTDVALMMTNGYSLVLELKKELTRVKLAIINLE